MLENRKAELEKEVAQRTSEVLFQKEQIERQHEELKSEKKKSDDLLLNILPSEIADELKEKGLSEARLYNNVTVLFTDFVDFTRAGERMSPRELVSELDACFKAFDEIIDRWGIEKIKTIGDAYLAVAGLPHPDNQHAEHVIGAALEIRKFIATRKQQQGDKAFDIRIGIHSGPVVAGIVGVKKFAYDIWGDTVNTAARMEQSSAPGKINISEATHELIKSLYECAYRGEISAKNKGELKMYFVEGKKLLEVA
jgi:class 3 adenylate cyclase